MWFDKAIAKVRYLFLFACVVNDVCSVYVCYTVSIEEFHCHTKMSHGWHFIGLHSFTKLIPGPQLLVKITRQRTQSHLIDESLQAAGLLTYNTMVTYPHTGSSTLIYLLDSSETH